MPYHALDRTVARIACSAACLLACSEPARAAPQSEASQSEAPGAARPEGDFVQYAGESQKNKLTYAELGELTRDITCAIKSNMPNALVAINHFTWNSDQVTRDFWGCVAGVDYDMVWTTGVPNNAGFFEASANASSYNAATATYAYVRELTGRTIFVDTSFGISGMDDSWSGTSPMVLNQRIADSVIAANVTMPAADYVATVRALVPQLDETCN